MIQTGKERVLAVNPVASLETVKDEAWHGVNQPTQLICFEGRALMFLLDPPSYLGDICHLKPPLGCLQG